MENDETQINWSAGTWALLGGVLLGEAAWVIWLVYFAADLFK